jgi:hypothetical protein
MNRRSFFKRMAGGIAGVAALPLASEADIAKEEDGRQVNGQVRLKTER